MADYDAYLTADDVRFSARDAALLDAIDEHGSLNAAATALGRSYARSHTRLTELEAAFGSLVERRRGGPDGGGSTLTEGARDVLGRFERLKAGYEGIAESEEFVLDGSVRDRHGELATIDTPVGPLRALTPPDVTDVEVTLRASAVTLHAPTDAPPEHGTSARNRLTGTVSAVDRGTAIARVAVDVGTPDPLVALLTAESVDTLDLRVGRTVVASFKATATRATPR